MFWEDGVELLYVDCPGDGPQFAAVLLAALVKDRDIAGSLLRTGAYNDLVDVLKGTHSVPVLIPVLQALWYDAVRVFIAVSMGVALTLLMPSA